MANCESCNNDRYKLIGCCSGYECGCRGLPVQFSNCLECNPDNDKEMHPSLSGCDYIKHLEFVRLTTNQERV